MKIKLLLITLLMTSFYCNTTIAQQRDFVTTKYNTKLRIQGTTSEKGFGASGVVEMSNINPYGPFVGAGLSYSNEHVDLAFHPGILYTKNSNDYSYKYVYSVAGDLRGTVNFNKNLFSWFNLTLTNLDDPRRLKANVFAMVDYKLNGKFKNLAVGLETDNSVNLGLQWFYKNVSTYGIGPNFLIVFNKNTRMEFSYQLRLNDYSTIYARFHSKF